MIDDETHWIGCIMRNGECLDGEIANLERAVRQENAPLGSKPGTLEGVSRERVGKDRDAVFPAQCFQSPGVVAVLVGEKNSGEFFNARARKGQCGFNRSGARSSIDKNLRLPARNEDGVSHASGGYDRGAQHLGVFSC